MQACTELDAILKLPEYPVNAVHRGLKRIANMPPDHVAWFDPKTYDIGTIPKSELPEWIVDEVNEGGVTTGHDDTVYAENEGLLCDTLFDTVRDDTEIALYAEHHGLIDWAIDRYANIRDRLDDRMAEAVDEAIDSLRRYIEASGLLNIARKLR